MPLPETEEEPAERDRQQRARRPSPESGEAEWEVRVSLPSREATHELAERLEGEGIPVTRRSTFLLVGAVNQDEAATELAERLRAEAPEGESRSSPAAPWSGRSAPGTRSPSSAVSAADNAARVG